MPEKLVLAYVDSLRTDMLLRAIEEGRAPTLGRLVRRGILIEDCISSFPSVTPVASAEIATGVGPQDHWIPGMNWYHRVEQRYVEYGSSLEATRAFGIFRSLHDLIYNMNLAHLNPNVETIFEQLDDRQVRTASTPFLIYRGRHRHDVTLQGLTGRAIERGLLKFDYGTWGPKELFYGDIYASMEVPCRPSSVPGRRDQYSACCAAELIARDRFDFLLLSFPDNDNYSHRFGPAASVDSIERADLSLSEVVRAAGGIEGFLADHALILLADHAHSEVDRPLDLIGSLSADWDVLQPSEDRPDHAELAVSPTSRAANIYLLSDRDNPRRHRRLVDDTVAIEGVELVAWLETPDGQPVIRSQPGQGAAPHPVVRVSRGGRELSFGPADGLTGRFGDELVDRGGRKWRIEGNLEALGASVQSGRLETPDYPDALERLHSALMAPHSGDLVVSAAPGYECLDWGGASHVGGGSHGSLHREDSAGPLLFVGCGPESPDERDQWTLRDVVPVIRDFYAART